MDFSGPTRGERGRDCRWSIRIRARTRRAACGPRIAHRHARPGRRVHCGRSDLTYTQILPFAPGRAAARSPKVVEQVIAVEATRANPTSWSHGHPGDASIVGARVAVKCASLTSSSPGIGCLDLGGSRSPAQMKRSSGRAHVVLRCGRNHSVRAAAHHQARRASSTQRQLDAAGALRRRPPSIARRSATTTSSEQVRRVGSCCADAFERPRERSDPDAGAHT